jgi:NADH dehydrogenase/NADH:ubiquinone oxidoreductase subunit G
MQPHPEIFTPYERLIEIEILGRKYQVPENNSILRCLQFLDMEEISNADLCWNGDCLNCQVWIENNGKEKALISCRSNATEGMKILRLSKDIPFDRK